MKRKNLFFILLSIMLLSVCLAVGFGCGDTEYQIETGGETGGISDEAVPYIVGADDIYIKLDAAEITVDDDEVYAVDNGSYMPIEIDVSDVVFGEKGEYDLVYVYNDLKISKKCYVFSEPSISNSNSGVIDIEYLSFFDTVDDGITAKDCMGNDLDVQVLSYGDAVRRDGSLVAGEHTISFIAVDKAGYKVKTEKEINILEGVTPEIEASYNYDVIDDGFSVTLSKDDSQSFLSFSIDEEPIPNENIVKNGETITISGDYLTEEFGIGSDKQLRVSTSLGSATANFAITDDAPVVYDDTEIKNFAGNLYECFGEYSVPAVTLLNHRQKVTPVYTVVKEEGGDNILGAGRKFSPEDDGEYTLTVTLKDQILTYKLSAFFNLGFVNGKVYSDQTGFDSDIAEGYTLKSYKVVKAYNGQEVLSYDISSGDKNTFEEEFKKLSKKIVYNLIVSAENEDGKTREQTVSFTMTGSGITNVLNSEEDLINKNFYVNNPEYAELQFITGEVDGVYGAFKYNAKGGTATSGDKSMMRFSTQYLDQMKKDSFMSFKVYMTKSTSLYYSAAPETILIYAQNGTAHANVRFYDEEGELITSGSFHTGELQNRWITVEIKLTKDFIDGVWWGIGFYNSQFSPASADVYFSDVRLSAESYMGA